MFELSDNTFWISLRLNYSNIIISSRYNKQHGAL